MSKSDKNVDFKLVKDASDLVFEKLKFDESSLDLKDQFNEKYDSGNHRYYLEPYNKQGYAPMMKHDCFVPLPNGIVDHFRNVESASFMGLLPEINRAWITIDNKLFLWNLSTPTEYTSYDGIADVIVSVALTVPKPNMFISSVKYFLVVATTVEVLVLALSWEDNYIPDNQLQNGMISHWMNGRHAVGSTPTSLVTKPSTEFRLKPTKYVIPTDNVTIVKVLGSSCGRIFMGGVDGNIHEVTYDTVDESWTNMMVGQYLQPHRDTLDQNGVRYKCQKLTHSTWTFQLVNLLPGFIKEYAGYNDSVHDMILDDIRHVLYSVTTKGKLNVFYLGLDGLGMQLAVSGYDVKEEIYNFLRYTNRDGMPTAEQMREGFANNSMEIVGMHVISITESRAVHVVLVLTAGIRVYLSLRDEGNEAFASNLDNIRSPASIHIMHVRSPPPADMLNTLRVGKPTGKDGASGSSASQNLSRVSYSNTPLRTPGTPKSPGTGMMAAKSLFVKDDGSLPRYIAHDAPHVHTSYYCDRVFILADSKPNEPDTLIGMTEDLISRSAANPMMTNTPQTSFPSNMNPQSASLRECISIVSSDGLAATIGGRVYDVRDVCNDMYNTDASQLHTLIIQSKTPLTANIKTRTTVGVVANPNATALTGTPYLGPSTTAIPYLARAGGNSTSGLKNVASLTELAWQSSPAVCPVSMKRHLMCLTNQGLHVLSKSRPIDYLYGILATEAASPDVYLESMRLFFNNYGVVPACAMCVAIACNVPFDITGSVPQSITPNSLDSSLRNKIMMTMFRITEGPSCITANKPLMPSNSIFDSRITYTSTGTASTKSYRNSAVHDGFAVFLSRILRPVWFKPVVDRNGLAAHFTPKIIHTIKESLNQLLNLLKEYFSAVLVRPMGDSSALALPASGAAAGELEDDRLMMEAQRLEEVSINTMGRLISRCIHALSLLNLMNDILVSPDLKRMNSSSVWSRFNNIDFYSFVCSLDCHLTVKQCVRDISDQLVFLHQGSHVCDLFINKLITHCYLYYNAADKLAFESLKLLSKLEILSTKDAVEVAYCLDNSCALLLQQSMFWDNVEDVVDTQGVTSASNLWVNCDRLSKCGANIPISTLTDALNHYERVLETIMDMCVITCNHFYGCILPNSAIHYTLTKYYAAASQSHFSGNIHTAELLPVHDGTQAGNSYEEYEKHLYRGSAVEALSDEVILRAKASCYTCLWHHIQLILSIPGSVQGAPPTDTDGSVKRLLSHELFKNPTLVQELVLHMVSRVCASTDDVELHNNIYSKLYQQRANDILLKLDSNVFFEDYFRQVDPVLLYKNYEYHHRYSDAADLMIAQATTTDKDSTITIHQRVEYLQKAVHSGVSAMSNPAGDHSYITSILTMDNVNNVNDLLTVAKLQLLIYESLAAQLNSILPEGSDAAVSMQYTESQAKELGNLKAVVQELYAGLKLISELYSITDTYKLWELSLRLLHVSNNDTVHLIHLLFRSIIYRHVPEKSCTAIGTEFLTNKRSGNKVLQDRRYQRRDTLLEQDTGIWFKEMLQALADLGKVLTRGVPGLEVYSNMHNISHASCVMDDFVHVTNIYPLAVIVKECIELHSLGQMTTGKVWCARGYLVEMLRELGYSYNVIMDAMMNCITLIDDKYPDMVLHHMDQVVFLLHAWVDVARVSDGMSGNMEQTELLQAIRSHSIQQWCDKLRHHLYVITSQQPPANIKPLLEQYSKDIRLVEQRIMNLVLA